MFKVYRLLLLSMFLTICLNADTLDFDCDDLYGCTDSKQSTTNKGSNNGGNREVGKATTKPTNNNKNKGNNIKAYGGFVVSGAMPSIGVNRKGFLYSVVLLTALFDNGVQKHGYGILLKDGYVLASADLMNDDGAYLRSVMAKIQDDSTNSLMCFAMLRLRATDDKLSLLRAENYTDIYCNTRSESFYHERINLHYFTPIYSGTLKHTVLSRNDKVLFPFVTENNALHYKTSSISHIQKHSAIHGLPLFNASGNFVGFLYSNNGGTKNKNVILSSDEVRDFICMVAKRKLLPTSDLTRACTKNTPIK